MFFCSRKNRVVNSKPRSKRVAELEEENEALRESNRQLKAELQHSEEANPLRCPITQAIIEDLVVCAVDGRCYDRAAIESWIEYKATSPVTTQPIDPSQLHAVSSLHAHIAQLHAANARASKQAERQTVVMARAIRRIDMLTTNLRRLQCRYAALHRHLADTSR